MPLSDQRKTHYARWKQLLNTGDGQDLMRELEALWDSQSILGDTPQDTAYAVGLRDAYKFLHAIQRGDYDG